MDIGLTFSRFVTGCIISALISVGGVWTVVQLSISGLQSAIQTTNDRIGDIVGDIDVMRADIKEIRAEIAKTSADVAVLKVLIERGFSETKQSIEKKASLELEDLEQFQAPKGGRVQRTELLAMANPHSDIQKFLSATRLLGDILSGPAIVFVPTEEAIEKAKATGAWENSGWKSLTEDETAEALVQFMSDNPPQSLIDLNIAKLERGGIKITTRQGTNLAVRAEGGKVTVSGDQAEEQANLGKIFLDTKGFKAEVTKNDQQPGKDGVIFMGISSLPVVKF